MRIAGRSETRAELARHPEALPGRGPREVRPFGHMPRAPLPAFLEAPATFHSKRGREAVFHRGKITHLGEGPAGGMESEGGLWEMGDVVTIGWRAARRPPVSRPIGAIDRTCGADSPTVPQSDRLTIPPQLPRAYTLPLSHSANDDPAAN